MPNIKNITQAEKLTELVRQAKAIYLTDYLGLNVEDINQLRRQFFKSDVQFRIAKNTLLKIAAKNNQLGGMEEFLSGPTAIAFSFNDPVNPAKVLKSFTKDHDLPSVKGIIFEGKIFSGDKFRTIADLPSREELLAKLLALLQSPLVKLMWGLKSPMSGLGHALNNLKDQKS
ncbi:MAG: 50S ribosomal protein L10 [Fidelibacterota bacterium]